MRVQIPLVALPGGVTGNTSRSEREEFRFESWPGNSIRGYGEVESYNLAMVVSGVRIPLPALFVLGM